MSETKFNWKRRFKTIHQIEPSKTIPFSEKIEIEQYLAEDKFLKQKVILKKIKINENPALKNLADYLWHYEISLNQRATNNSKGNTLLRLVFARKDEVNGVYVLATEHRGLSLKDLLLAEEETEESLAFRSFINSNKKLLWDAILRLVEGLYALHSSGLIHRNISLDTIYFDSEAYLQGEKNFLKIGNFNWSIYLYSLSNVFENEITSELIKNNYHFFRAPECLPLDVNIGSDCTGETYQSDLFSLGLVLAFILLRIDDINKYNSSEIENRPILYREIQDKVGNYGGYPLESEILLKMIDINPDDRFQNIDETLSSIRNLLALIERNFLSEGNAPVYFPLERNSPFLRQISNTLGYSIDAVLDAPNDFLSMEFNNSKLCLTNDPNFPLWSKGKSGIYYKFRRAFRRGNLANIRSFFPGVEHDLKLTDIGICTIGTFFWNGLDGECPYSRWREIFTNAASQIRQSEMSLDPILEKRKQWLDILTIIEDAEEEIEKKRILEYNLIYDSINRKDDNVDQTRYIIIQVINDPDKEMFNKIFNDASINFIELVDTDNLFEYFKRKRAWKFIGIEEDARNYTQIRLEGKKRNEDPFENGYIRLWELKNTVFLLKRKRLIIQNLENNEHLLNAILLPASTHMYFKDYDKNKLVSFIYYTNPIFLLQGPPGTGKTYTAIELIRLTLLKDPFSRILISSKEHATLDDLLKKTVIMLEGEEIQPNPHLVRLISPERELNYLPTSVPVKHFITVTTKKILKELFSWNSEDPLHLDLIQKIRADIVKELETPSREWLEMVKESSNLIFCTSTAQDLKELEFASQNFDLVIIEEAGKTYPSELFKPMQLGNKWVLIGDQNQLPPFRMKDIVKIIEDKLDEREKIERIKDNFNPSEFSEFRKMVLKNIKVFDFIFKTFQEIKHSFDTEDNTKSCDTLNDQYRLPSKISRMISSIFYNKEFIQKIEDPNDFILEPRYFNNEQLIWVNIPSDREFREKRDGVKIYNPYEIEIIRKILEKISINQLYYPFTLAILSPYKEQKELLKLRLPSYLPNLKGINIKESCFTVDGFQGQEADLVIISLVRNNFNTSARGAWGFIRSIERLNVMLSRAKKAEIIVGNYDMCIIHKKDPFMEKFAKVAEFIKKEGKIIKSSEVK